MHHVATDFTDERNELQAVLDSGIFNRAPNLANVLTYVCAKYFEGAGEQIKEYNIAVEALGRPAEFDQRRDSIVRVEAHRLRKRLRDFYEAEGASHSVRIEIPSGQYAPQFLRQTPPLPSLSEVAVVLPVEEPEIQAVATIPHAAPPPPPALPQPDEPQPASTTETTSPPPTTTPARVPRLPLLRPVRPATPTPSSRDHVDVVRA